MNERMSIDGEFFADLAKEVGLNTSHLDVLGERQHWEIVVGGNMLERLVGIQRQFERLAVMGTMSTGDSISRCPGLRRKSGAMPRS